MIRSLILIVTIILFGILGLDFYSSSVEYTLFRENLELERERKNYAENLFYYYEKQGEYPESYVSSDTILMNYVSGLLKSPSLEKYEDRYYIDHSSKNRSYYKYVPIYDIESNKRNGFLFLASGVDGKIDNNSEKIYNVDIPSLKIYDNENFNYWNLWFGSKDIILYKNSMK